MATFVIVLYHLLKSRKPQLYRKEILFNSRKILFRVRKQTILISYIIRKSKIFMHIFMHIFDTASLNQLIKI